MATMKMMEASKLNIRMLRRMLRENNSLRKKYSDTMSSRRITMKMVSFFINKKKGCDPAAVPWHLSFGIQYWWLFIGKCWLRPDVCIVLPYRVSGCFSGY